MSTAKKATPVKRTVKKATARKTTPPARARMSGPAVIDQAGAPVDEVIADDTVDEAAPAEDQAPEAAPAPLATIDLALSHRGKRTGATQPVRVHRPTETQLVWFEAAAHRFDLAMEAWKEGAALDVVERGEVYNDALNAMNVFVATRHDRAWISQAMAQGILELDAVIDGIHQAKDVLDLTATGPGAGADIVVP